MERKIRRSTSTSLLSPPDLNLSSSPPCAIVAIPCCNQNGPPLPPLPVMPNCIPTAPLRNPNPNPNPNPHPNNPYAYPHPHAMIPLPEEPFIAFPPSSSLSSSFLDSCFLCKRRLGQTRDIFIYRGDRAFCSVECRHHQIMLDESKQKASGEKGNGHTKHHSGKVTVSTGTTAAA